MTNSISVPLPKSAGYLKRLWSGWHPEVRTALAAFALTLLSALVVIQSGIGARGLRFIRSIDTEVILFLAPTLAIVFAMFFLAARLTWHGSTPEFRPTRRRQLRWGTR